MTFGNLVTDESKGNFINKIKFILHMDIEFDFILLSKLSSDVGRRETLDVT